MNDDMPKIDYKHITEASISRPTHGFHVCGHDALVSILRHGLVPDIGPRSASVKEPDNAIYMFYSSEAAEDGVSTWLGDEFDDNVALCLLKVKIREQRLKMDGDSYEFICYDKIPPEDIEVISEDL